MLLIPFYPFNCYSSFIWKSTYFCTFPLLEPNQAMRTIESLHPKRIHYLWLIWQNDAGATRHFYFHKNR